MGRPPPSPALTPTGSLSTLGLDQGGGEADLRELRLELPAGLIANPAAVSACTAAAFGAPRPAPSASGESCPDRSQVGTVEVQTAGETRRFGIFNLDPAPGAAMQLGASPFGHRLVFDAQIRAGGQEPFGLSLSAAEVPEALALRALELTLWGTPGEATHNTQRGNCLNEVRALLCPLQGLDRRADLNPAACLPHPADPLRGPALLHRHRPRPGRGRAVERRRSRLRRSMTATRSASIPSVEGQLSVKKASSSTGFVFRLENDDTALANPRARIRSHARRAVVQLPGGVTLNPSLGAGLEVCTPAQLAAESAFNPPGAGCPNGAKIGVFQVRSQFYTGFLKGGIYLAQPDHPATGAPGAENPFDSLLAVYMIAKSVDRGLLFRFPGELAPDPGDGTITATFDNLPQFPYTDLEVNFRSWPAGAADQPACLRRRDHPDHDHPLGAGRPERHLLHRLPDRDRDRRRPLPRRLDAALLARARSPAASTQT